MKGFATWMRWGFFDHIEIDLFCKTVKKKICITSHKINNQILPLTQITKKKKQLGDDGEACWLIMWKNVFMCDLNYVSF